MKVLPGNIEEHEPRRRREDTWQARAPRWFLLAMIGMLIAALGSATTLLVVYRNAEVSAGYLSREAYNSLANRVGDLESKYGYLEARVVEVKADTKSTAETVSEIKAEIRTANGKLDILLRSNNARR